MSCQPHRRRPLEQRAVALAEPPGSRAAEARVGDVERARTAEVLGDAAAGGYLRLDELDDRLGRVWASSTRGELAALVADLPPRAPEPPTRAAGAGAHLAAYLVVMLLLVTVWLVVGLAGGGWYPWPVWPALGWGACVARRVHASARGGGS